MRSLIVLTLLCSLISIAAADPSTPRTRASKAPATPHGQMKTDDCAKARKAGKQCVLDMGTEDVKGNTPVKDGIDTSVVNWVQLGSLLHIRRDFIPEIVKSADDLD